VSQEHSTLNESNEAVVGPDADGAELEAVVDQLVDELCQRLVALHGLVEASAADLGPRVAEIRARAGDMACRLTGPQARTAAVSVARALWPPQLGTPAPEAWWATPLGAVISNAVASPSRNSNGATTAAEVAPSSSHRAAGGSARIHQVTGGGGSGTGQSSPEADAPLEWRRPARVGG
jgi:hypothetical protein